MRKRTRKMAIFNNRSGRLMGLAQVYDPSIPGCVDPATGYAVPCPGEDGTWIGWSILLQALGTAALTWGQAMQQKQYYQSYGYRFPMQSSTQYQTQYQQLKTLHPDWSDSQIRDILTPTDGYYGEKTPTWVWIALAAAGVLILIPLLQKRS